MTAGPNISRTWTAIGALVCAGSLGLNASAFGQPAERLLDKTTYQARLRAMWLGESIANWTGLAAEGERQAPPFLTDADWGTQPFPDRPWALLGLNLWGHPWNSDDDTDVEYVYLHVMSTQGLSSLTPEQIVSGWRAHINRAIWVSNQSARAHMDRGIVPPMTAAAQGMASGVPAPVDQSLMIDAQLTTEFFGALCPGMPERALAIADLPIRTTATGYAVHASQVYVVLYSLATQVDPELSGAEQAQWLIREARKFIPDSSKSADIMDFVLADYLANPDKNNWTLTRDRVYERYVAGAASHGFVYRAWYESSVNFAMGMVALLYGGMDFEKTVRIGTLAGFDADNQPATLGGLIGLVQGPAFLATYGWCYDEYHWLATRDGLIDYLPNDPTAEDTFTMMAARMLPIVDREVQAGGGRASSSAWLLPPQRFGAGVSPSACLGLSPTAQLDTSSANNQVRRTGGLVIASTNVPGSASPGIGSAQISLLANGYEHDFRGLEDDGTRRGYVTTQRPAGTQNIPVEHSFEVHYTSPVNAGTVRFIGGDLFTSGAAVGGWFENVRAELEINGQWVPATLTSSKPAPTPSATTPFQVMDFELATPTVVTGARVIGTPHGFASCCEIDVLSPTPAPARGFDLNADGRVDIEDLYEWERQPADLTGDGVADDADRQYLNAAIRWNESAGMAQTQRPTP